MDRMTSLQVFRCVVENGSFAVAADRLSISAPMASKHITSLERSLGARLLHRSSRHLSLTEAGSVYYEKCCQALDTLSAAESEIGNSVESPRGQLRISAPVWCANAGLAAIFASYIQRYPEVSLDVRLENRKVDLVQDGFDLALRATQEPNENLIARPLCKVPFYLVGTPAYLKKKGWPGKAGTVTTLDAILPSYIKPEFWRVGVSSLAELPFQLHTAILTDDTTLAYHLVKANTGVAMLPEWLIGEDIQQGRLSLLMSNHHPSTPITLFAVYVSRRHLPQKLRTFIDFLSEHLAKNLD